MKVRLTPGAIRIRLAPAEVARLAEQQALEDEVVFAPGARLTLALLPDAIARTTSALCLPYRIEVRTPAAPLAAWAEGKELGFYAEQAAGGGLLRIEVEKDLRPKRPRRERADGR